MTARSTLPPRITNLLFTTRQLARARRRAAAEAAANSSAVPDAGEPVPGEAAATRAKISRAHQGRPVSAQTRAKISQALKGRPASAQARAKHSAAIQGHPVSAATRAKISRAHQGRPLSAETRAKISRGGILGARRGKSHQRYVLGGYAMPERPLETLDDAIDELSARQARLSALIDEKLAARRPVVKDVITLLALHAENAGKLLYLLRYQQQTRATAAADELAQAVNQALDELAQEKGWNV
jgi:hypothetical protein